MLASRISGKPADRSSAREARDGFPPELEQKAS